VKELIFSPTALKSLRKHANRAALIERKIGQYASDPASQANHVTALVGSPFLRLRVGDFRVILLEMPDAVTIIDLGPRGEIYRKYG
jgi:mRNA interferase RelE/StbE